MLRRVLDTRPRPLLCDLPEADQIALIAGAHDSAPVRGLTHDFYKYPARFSPAFVRAAIKVFTRPGDLVLDNHVGGGTTLVEALALGRNALGVDISALAEFVARVKTTVLTPRDIQKLSLWAQNLPLVVSARKPSSRLTSYEKLGYYKHLTHPDRWRLRKAIEQSIAHATSLSCDSLIAFGRCVVLRASQRALDGRRTMPDLHEFRSLLRETATEMIEAAREFSDTVNAHPVHPGVTILNRSSSGLEKDAAILRQPPPKLVITSPPYPGVHVLYHRWQVDGRREAPLPFMIANKLDGAGSSYYTMGDRAYPELRTYFANVLQSMSSVAKIADDQTTVVQLVAFSDASWQLPKYLEIMEQAGLTEVFLPIVRRGKDGRVWRTVPGRRWYTHRPGSSPGSTEVLFIHRKSK